MNKLVNLPCIWRRVLLMHAIIDENNDGVSHDVVVNDDDDDL